LTLPERYRAIALSTHLGTLAELLGKPPSEEEEWLVWGVEEFIKIYKERTGIVGNEGAFERLDRKKEGEGDVDESELGLPRWMRKGDKGEFESVLERLGAFYARRGNVE